jgi:hypothetical protein
MSGFHISATVVLERMMRAWFLVSGLLLCSACSLALSNPALAAQPDVDPAIRLLVLAETAVGVAQTCGASVDQARQAAAYISARLKQQRPELAAKITEEEIYKAIESIASESKDIVAKRHGAYFDKPCSYWRGMLAGLLSAKGTDLDFKSSDETASKEEDDKKDDVMTFAEIKDRLDELANTLPKGQLADFQGCWQAEVSDDWMTRLCFKNGGDEVEVDLTGPNNNRCALRAGKARKRNDGAYFFAYSETGKCANGRAIQHIEGYCEIESDTQTCLVSLFYKDNSFFLADESDGESGINGEFEFARVR